MNRRIASCAAALVLAALPAATRAETVAITGGTVYPVAGPRIPNGTVVIANGVITAVGAHVAIPAGARRIDARGKIVTPGLINAVTTVGIVEVQEERAANNASAKGAISAAFRPWDGFFSESAMIPSTREEGITTVGIMPFGSFVAGQAAFVDLGRGTAHDMLRKGPVAVVTSFGGPSGGGGDRDETAGTPDTAGGNAIDGAPASRGEGIGRLRSLFADARFYEAHRTAYDEGRARTLAASRDDLEALLPVVHGRLPLVIEADRVDDIDDAIRFGADEHVHVIVAGGAEAWRIAARLAAAHVPVLAGAMNNIPASFDQLNQRQDNLALLRAAGVTVVLVGNTGGGDDDVGFNARNIRYEAGNAVAYGLSHDDALRAITLAPATVFGVADRIGALTPGRDANLVIWSGDPFEFSSVAEHVFVKGREIDDRSRQDELIDRYKTLPRKNNAP
jgi:imidazolonepropionase-like amidohydrolase